jgi:hypothetical protein
MLPGQALDTVKQIGMGQITLLIIGCGVNKSVWLQMEEVQSRNRQ